MKKSIQKEITARNMRICGEIGESNSMGENLVVKFSLCSDVYSDLDVRVLQVRYD